MAGPAASSHRSRAATPLPGHLSSSLSRQMCQTVPTPMDTHLPTQQMASVETLKAGLFLHTPNVRALMGPGRGVTDGGWTGREAMAGMHMLSSAYGFVTNSTTRMLACFYNQSNVSIAEQGAQSNLQQVSC